MKKILTIIISGFGEREDINGNAIKLAKMHNYEEFYKKSSHTLLDASGKNVGLDEGQFGNSEFGHMTIGAGRNVNVDTKKIEKVLDDLNNNLVYQELIKDNTKKVHIIGLCSDGKIHSNISYFIKMYESLIQSGITNIYFHLITDGIDTKIRDAERYIKIIQGKINEYGFGKIATICGRCYAMDRNENYDRTKVYYDLIMSGIGIKANDTKSALYYYYEKGLIDKYIKPTIIDKNGIISDDDIVIWMNYKSDRSYQFLDALTNKDFDKFPTFKYNDLKVYTLNQIDNIKTNVFVSNSAITNSLGMYLAKLDMKQARIAEKCKGLSITYFFDGKSHEKIKNCDKFILPSLASSSNQMPPEMNAIGITKKIIECMEKDYDFILAGFANPDVIGHTGNVDATTKACMAVDICLGRIFEAAEENFYTVIITSDHGNADTMYSEDGIINASHSLSKVPFIISDSKIKLKDGGNLSNVAPTILDYMDISIPEEMTAESLIDKE